MANSEAWALQDVFVDDTPPAAEAQGFAYHQRPDGTAEYAKDVDDAIRRGCTELARIAIEAPDEADALFQLAARPVEAPVKPVAAKVQETPKADKPKIEPEKPQPPKLVKVHTEPEVIEQPRTVASPVIELRQVQPVVVKDAEVTRVRELLYYTL